MSPTAKELPIQLYETGTQMVNSIPKMLFVKLPYKIETVEAERVSVDHVAKVSATSGDAGSTACTCTHRSCCSGDMIGIVSCFLDSWTAKSLLFVDPRFRRNPIAPSLAPPHFTHPFLSLLLHFSPPCVYPPAVSTHLSSVKNAVQMLRQRVEILKQYLRATKDGSVPMNHRLLRQVASVCAQLPAVNVGEFESQFLDVRKT